MIGAESHVATHAYARRSSMSVHEAMALLARLTAVSASAMPAKIIQPLCSLNDPPHSINPMSATMAIGSIASTM